MHHWNIFDSRYDSYEISPYLYEINSVNFCHKFRAMTRGMIIRVIFHDEHLIELEPSKDGYAERRIIGYTIVLIRHWRLPDSRLHATLYIWKATDVPLRTVVQQCTRQIFQLIFGVTCSMLCGCSPRFLSIGARTILIVDCDFLYLFLWSSSPEAAVS